MKKFVSALLVSLFCTASLAFWATTHAATTNLIANPSVEQSTGGVPTSWSNAKTGTNTTSFNYLNTGHTGNQSLQVQMTKRSSGQAEWYFNSINVKPSTNYTFTDWYKSNVQSHLQVVVTRTTGATSNIASNNLSSSTNWKQASISFTTPSNAKTLTVYHYLNQVGQLTTDDFDIEGVVPTPPIVSLTSPANGATVNNTQTVTASASSSDPISNVQFKLDGNNLGTADTTNPYSTSWDTKTATSGNHVLTAVATNTSNLSTTSNPVTVNVQNPTPPTVQISSPASGVSLSGTQTISANANDAQGISNVQFKLNGINLGSAITTAPYSMDWDTISVSDGSYNITAVATNTSNLSTTSGSVAVTVQNQATPPPPVSQNIIPNPSAETPDSANPNTPAQWLSNNWGTNTAQFSYLNTSHSGSRSLKTEITSYSSGDAKWYFNPVIIQGNTSYTFTDYYQASVDTEVVAQYSDAQGNLSYAWLGAAPASSNWATYGITFTTPASATNITIFHLIAKVGWLVIDDGSLTTTPVPPTSTSYIPNPSVEYASASNSQIPANWTTGNWGTNTANFQYLNEGHSGSHSLKVTVSNYVSGDAKWYFNPITTLQPGSQYRFSTWYKTNTIPHAVAMYTMADGTEKYFGMPNPQPNGGSDWQFYTDTFNVPLGANSVSAFLFVPNNGWLQTDDYSLTDYQPTGWNRPLVSLTFDDGYEDNVTTVLPVFNQYGFKSTQCYETADVEGNTAAANDILAFYNSGHEICAHTVTHPFLTQVPLSQLTYELTHSQQYLQSLIGSPVSDFASPYGDYNQAVNTEIAKYFRSHRTVDEGFNSKDNFDIYRLRVQNLTTTTTLAQFQSWLDQAKATNTWLILVYHRVASSGLDPFDTYKVDFDKQMQALNQSGLTVKTWSAALDEVTAQL